MTGKTAFLLLKPGSDRLRVLIDRLNAYLAAVRAAPAPTPPSRPPAPHGRGHMETVVQGGRIWTPYGLAPPGLSDGIMAHWPQEVWTDAARLSYLESSWRYDATNDTRWKANGQCNQRYYLDPPGIWAQTEHSIGFFQINICAHGGTPEQWKVPDNNCAKGAQLYNQSGWHPWTYSANQLGLI